MVYCAVLYRCFFRLRIDCDDCAVGVNYLFLSFPAALFMLVVTFNLKIVDVILLEACF